jgi:putative peptidoglycan lipid II flippase
VALIVIVLGFALDADTDSPLLFPVGEPVPPPTATSAPAAPAPVVGTEAPRVPSQPVAFEATGAFDPFGDGSEHDDDVGLMTDGQSATAWRTERYFDPLQLIKPGVGATFSIDGTVSTVTIEGSPGTAIVLAWSPGSPAAFDEWQQLGSVVLTGDPATVEVSPKAGGTWLLWLTDLPAQDGGEYHYATLAEVGFGS